MFTAYLNPQYTQKLLSNCDDSKQAEDTFVDNQLEQGGTLFRKRMITEDLSVFEKDSLAHTWNKDVVLDEAPHKKISGDTRLRRVARKIVRLDLIVASIWSIIKESRRKKSLVIPEKTEFSVIEVINDDEASYCLDDEDAERVYGDNEREACNME